MWTLEDLERIQEIKEQIENQFAEQAKKAEEAQLTKDGLVISFGEMGDTAPFYSETHRPLQDDEALLRDAHYDCARNFGPLTKEMLGWKAPVQKLREGIIRKPIKEKTPDPLSTRLEAGLLWEVRHEDGIGVEPKKAAKAENLLRCLKMKFALRSVYFKLGGTTCCEPRKVPASDRLILLWPIDDKLVITLSSLRYGQERIIQAYHYNGSWTETNAIGQAEFPLYELSNKKMNGKWVFELPSVQAIVGTLTNPTRRDVLDDEYFRFEERKKYIRDQAEQETCCTYIAIDSHATHFLSESEEGNCSYETEAFSTDRSPVDVDWSEQKKEEIFSGMDPSGKGYATQPMPGTIFRYGKEVPRHKSIKQSLFWLLGSTKRKIKGFYTHSALTREVREAIFQFAMDSWKFIDEGEKHQQSTSLQLLLDPVNLLETIRGEQCANS